MKAVAHSDIGHLANGSVVMDNLFRTYMKMDGMWVPRKIGHDGDGGWSVDNQISNAVLAGRASMFFQVYSPDSLPDGWITNGGDITEEVARQYCNHDRDGDCFDDDHNDYDDLIDPDNAYEYCGHPDNGDCFDADHIYPDDADDYCSHDDDEEECAHHFSVWPTQVTNVNAIHIDGRYICDEDQISKDALDKLKEVLS